MVNNESGRQSTSLIKLQVLTSISVRMEWEYVYFTKIAALSGGAVRLHR